MALLRGLRWFPAGSALSRRSACRGRSTRPVNRAAPRGLKAAVGPVAIGVVAACIVLPGLTAQSVSYDEGVSAAMATARWPSFAGTAIGGEANMSLYYLLLRCLPPIHPGAAALRAPSAAAFIVAVPLVAVAGAQLMGRVPGLIGAALVATNAHVVNSAQTARSYALLMALSVASTVLLLRAGKSRGRHDSAWVLGWGVVSGLTAYVHLLGVVTTAAQVVAVGLAWPRRLRSLLVGLVAAALLWAPLGVVALRQGTASISWIKKPSLEDLGSVAAEVAGGVGPLVVIAAASIWALATKTVAREPAVRFLLAMILVPLAGVYLVSLLGPTPLLLPRYLIAVAPAGALLVGVAVTHASRPVLVAGLAVVAVAGNLHGLVARNTSSAEDFRAAAEQVNRQARVGDVSAFVDPTAAAAFAVYARPGAPPSVFPEIAPGASLYDGRQGLGHIGEEVPDAVRAARAHSRVWVIESHTTTEWAAALEGRLLAGLENVGYTRHDSRSFPGVRVLLYTAIPQARS